MTKILLNQFSRIPRKLLLAAIFGIALRFLLAPFSGHPYDMWVWFEAISHISGGASMQDVAFQNTPMLYYTFFPISYFYSFLSKLLDLHPVPLDSLPAFVQSAASWTIPCCFSVSITEPLFNLIIKTAFIISDILSAILIYKIVYEKYGRNAAGFSFVLWFLNPMLIWVSSIWGMFDSLAAFFTILSMYFLIKGKNSRSALSLAVASGYKLFPILLLVPIGIYMYRGTPSLRRLVSPALSFLFAFVLLFIPLLQHPSFFIQSYLSSPANSPASDPSQTYGLTYWSLAPFTNISGIMANDLSILLLIELGIITASISIVILLKKCTFANLLFCQLLTTSTIFFSYLRVNEQWFVWLLPPLVMLSATGSIKKRYIILISSIAMFYSWVNSLFAAFFLPTMMYNANFIRELYSLWELLIPYRLDLMAFIGIVFSSILFVIILRINDSFRSSLKTTGITETNLHNVQK
jgi:hypothetical protein